MNTSEIENLLAAATPGEWVVGYGEDENGDEDKNNFGVRTEAGSFITFAFPADDGGCGGDTEANAQLMARSRDLAAEVLLLTARIAALEAVVKAMVDAGKPLLDMALWTESAADGEIVIMTVGTIRKLRTALSALEAKT